MRSSRSCSAGVRGGMKLVVFGLSVSSSWGNGHATLWRGLIRALARRGHATVFFERDVPYYAEHRDLTRMEGLRLELYGDWEHARRKAESELSDADVGIVTSYCPDGAAACDLVRMSRAHVRLFYDLDTPVTLERMEKAEDVPYIGSGGLSDFDLVLSFTGGQTLDKLRALLGTRFVAPLYGHVDPDLHRPIQPPQMERADLSYLGTYAADRQKALEALFFDPARLLPGQRFVLAGALYPKECRWTANIEHVKHLAPGDHPAFFSSSRMTLNVTRQVMAAAGWCPSGRLFEASACGTPIVSDWWEGLDQFYTPGREILIARNTADVIAALGTGDDELQRIANAARERTLQEHTAAHRAAEFESLVQQALRPAARTAA